MNEKRPTGMGCITYPKTLLWSALLVSILVAGAWSVLVAKDTDTKRPVADEMMRGINEEVIKINSDKEAYYVGERVRLVLQNTDTVKTYMISDRCGWVLERKVKDKWVESGWVECAPACGRMFELSSPVFVVPGSERQVVWDQKVEECVGDDIGDKRINGIYRSVAVLVEDINQCHEKERPESCWREQKKEFMQVVSNEFVLK